MTKQQICLYIKTNSHINLEPARVKEVLGNDTSSEITCSAKFWQGKLWRMLNTCIIGRRKMLQILKANYLLLTR